MTMNRQHGSLRPGHEKTSLLTRFFISVIFNNRVAQSTRAKEMSMEKHQLKEKWEKGISMMMRGYT